MPTALARRKDTRRRSTTMMMAFAGPSLAGELFLYAAGRAAFESPSVGDASRSETGPSKRRNKCILLGGLSDGLWPVPYTQALFERAIAPTEDWSLVQPILSSSYLGFGNGSMERDTHELDELFAYLLEQRDANEFGLVGHSTGCQNAVHYMKHGKYRDRLKIVALQAPVSDREHAQLESSYRGNLERATRMRDEGRQDEMMPRSAFWAPITASRFLDLQERAGRDDFFSSDFSDAELAERLQHVGQRSDRRVLVAFSGADEYVPASVGDPQVLLNRLVAAMNAQCATSKPVAIPLYLPKANHNLLEAPGDGDTFVESVGKLLIEACTAIDS